MIPGLRKIEKDYLVLKRASASRPSGQWSDDDYDVLAGGVMVGRIFKANAAPVDAPWFWTLAFGYLEDRIPTHGLKVGGENNQEKAAGVDFSATGPSARGLSCAAPGELRSGRQQG